MNVIINIFHILTILMVYLRNEMFKSNFKQYGQMEKQSWGESEKRKAEERRSEKRKVRSHLGRWEINNGLTVTNYQRVFHLTDGWFILQVWCLLSMFVAYILPKKSHQHPSTRLRSQFFMWTPQFSHVYSHSINRYPIIRGSCFPTELRPGTSRPRLPRQLQSLPVAREKW